MSDEVKLKPEFWAEQYGIKIHDPDGWRNPGDPSWNTPLTRDDFEQRMRFSTIAVIDNDLYRKMMRQ
jgi:hypothetical protein